MAIKTQFGDPKDAKFSNEHLDDYYQNWWYLGTINSPANPSLECDFYFDPVRHLTSLVYGPEPGRYETLLIDYDKDTKRVSASKGVYPCPDSYAARVKEHLARINTVWPMPTCYQCGTPTNWLAPDSRCGECTRLTPEEVRGVGV